MSSRKLPGLDTPPRTEPRPGALLHRARALFAVALAWLVAAPALASPSVAEVAAAAAPVPPDPVARRPSRVQTTFESVDAVVAAEWDFPEHSPAPLVVLIPVVGRIDRHGLRPGTDEQPENGVYARLTKALVESGFAVFRYDQPGAGRSSPGRFATDRSTALEAYTKAVAHARVDPERVFLLGHSSGTTTIASIFPRFESVQKPAGVVFLDSVVGEYDAARVHAPLLIVNPDRDPDNRYRYGEYVVESRRRGEDGPLETKLVIIDDSGPGLLARDSKDGGSVALDRRAVRATISWLRAHLR
ncbi:MAG: alpha/beta fold hydrolase [Deltaproteobacteria bacterium]|nr:MAG: alpha/beta fold hydrolase [Deltaproteobacteria bacterium]